MFLFNECNQYFKKKSTLLVKKKKKKLFKDESKEPSQL